MLVKQVLKKSKEKKQQIHLLMKMDKQSDKEETLFQFTILLKGTCPLFYAARATGSMK